MCLLPLVLAISRRQMLVRPATLLFCWPELRLTCCWSILLAASTYRVHVRFPSNSEEVHDSLTVCSTAFSTLLCPEGADDFTATTKFYAYQAALAGDRNFVRSCEICCAALLSLGENAGSWARSCHLGPAGASACADRQLRLLRSLLLQAPSAFEKDFWDIEGHVEMEGGHVVVERVEGADVRTTLNPAGGCPLATRGERRLFRGGAR